MTSLSIKEKEWHNGVDNQDVDARRRELTAMLLGKCAEAIVLLPIGRSLDREYFA